jgi:hypothetical protein
VGDLALAIGFFVVPPMFTQISNSFASHPPRTAATFNWRFVAAFLNTYIHLFFMQACSGPLLVHPY